MENKGGQILQIVIFYLLVILIGAIVEAIEVSNLSKWAKWSTGVMVMTGLWLLLVLIVFKQKDK